MLIEFSTSTHRVMVRDELIASIKETRHCDNDRNVISFDLDLTLTDGSHLLAMGLPGSKIDGWSEFKYDTLADVIHFPFTVTT